MNKKNNTLIQPTEKRAAKIIATLEKLYPGSEVPLRHSNPFELLIATILSAQCTDERVNRVTPVLFKAYPTPEKLGSAKREDVERIIHSTGFYRAKAANIISASKIISDKFGGKVPRTMSELLTLPGVARKTANVVLSHGYNVIEGVVVDTHVSRLARRLGFTDEESPEKIETALMKILPAKNDWKIFPLLLQYHGRARCRAKNPDCPSCEIKDLCPSAGIFSKA